MRMEADVPLGAFLSGGIDSSLDRRGDAARAARGTGRSFCVGFPDGGFDEAPHAAAVARHLGTEHTTLDGRASGNVSTCCRTLAARL